MGFRALMIAVWVCLAAFNSASAQTKDRLDRRDKLFGFEAVGLLESAQGRCTAALITRDVVLTAAHCVHGKGQKFIFRAGYSDGSSIATRTTESVVIAKEYMDAIKDGDRVAAIANDVALVRLTSPIFDPGANPYEIAKTPGQGTALTLVSYGRGRMEALTLERGCALHTVYRGGIVGIDCDATFGSSGAPVFVQVEGRNRIFSIVSSGTSGSNGQPETLGVALTTLVPKLMTSLRNKRSLAPISGGARRIPIGERTSGGARFERPNGS